MKTVTKIALIALLWITAINSGTLDFDTERRLQMAHAWWTGTEEVSPNYRPRDRVDIDAGVRGADGRRYIAYEVGQSLLMLPADWVGTQIQQLFHLEKTKTLQFIVVNFLVFIPLNIAAVVSCFWLLRLFNFEERIAGLATIAWLLSTTALHYAQVSHQNHQVLLFIIIGYAAALAYVQRGHPRFALLSGLSVSAAVLIRTSSIIHAFTVLLFLVGCTAYQSRDKLKVLQKVVGLWIVGFIPLTLLGRVFDYIRYGSFWATGASVATQQQQVTTDPFWLGVPQLPANYPLINEPSIGILGVLFSPAKSIFIYDPLLLPCLVLGVVLWKKLSPYMQWYLITGIFNLGLHIALTSRLVFWHGDWAWGARYHVTSIHLLLIPLIALFIQRLLLAKGLTVWLMRLILVLSSIVQIVSVTMPYYLEIAQGRISQSALSFEFDSKLSFRLGQRATNIICLVDSSFSQKCPSKLSPAEKGQIEQFNRLAFIPFALNQKAVGKLGFAKFSVIFFVIWGLVLTLAIASTIWFIFWGNIDVRGLAR